MTSARTKRENICDECGLPISICNAKALFEVAVKRNGRELVIAAILDAKTEQTAPDVVARLWHAARLGLDMARANDLTNTAETIMEAMNAVECTCKGSDEMCPCQNRRPAPDAVARLVEAARTFASWDHCWPGNVNLEAACRDIRAALVAMENEQCQVSIGPATGAIINGPRGSGVGAPAAVDNSRTDTVARLVEAAKVLRPYLTWTVGPESPGHHPTMPSAVDAFLSALAAMETSHD